MFPDTSNFTDPNYTDWTDPNTDPLTGLPVPGGTQAPYYETPTWTPAPPASGGASTNTPVQSGQSGFNLLGWLDLGTRIAQTTIYAARGGQPAPGGARP